MIIYLLKIIYLDMVSYLELNWDNQEKEDLLPHIDKLAVGSKTRNEVVRDKLYNYLQYIPEPRSEIQCKIDRNTEQLEEKKLHGKSLVIIADGIFILELFHYAINHYRDGMHRHRKVIKCILYESFGLEKPTYLKVDSRD
jgi:hypothetical protein